MIEYKINPVTGDIDWTITGNQKLLDSFNKIFDDFMKESYFEDVNETKKQLNNYNQMANPKPGMKQGSKSTNHKKEEAAGLKPFKVKDKPKK